MRKVLFNEGTDEAIEEETNLKGKTHKALTRDRNVFRTKCAGSARRKEGGQSVLLLQPKFFFDVVTLTSRVQTKSDGTVGRAVQTRHGLTRTP